MNTSTLYAVLKRIRGVMQAGLNFLAVLLPVILLAGIAIGAGYYLLVMRKKK